MLRDEKKLAGKNVVITGGSRGIGLAIAKRVAQLGANVAILAKSAEEQPKLPGTIYTAAKEIEAFGVRALPLQVDIRFEEEVQKAIECVVKELGGVDILVNNASAISLTSTEVTTMKRYDLMHGVNARGTFLVSKTCVPYLKQSENAHVLMLSPPLSLDAKWFQSHVAYTMAKFGMSLCVLGMAEEFRNDGIAFNALWPVTTIATAAIANLLGGDEMMRKSRKPEIVADAAAAIFCRKSSLCTGNFFLDEQVLKEEGVSDFTHYAVDPSATLMPDFFI